MRGRGTAEDGEDPGAIEWLARASDELHRRGMRDSRRHDRRIVIAFALGLLVIWIVGVVMTRVVFGQVSDKLLAAAPDREDWAEVISRALLPVEVTLTVGALGFLFVMLVAFSLILRAVRSFVNSRGAERRMLTTPQLRAAHLVLSGTDLKSSGSHAKRFVIVACPPSDSYPSSPI